MMSKPAIMQVTIVPYADGMIDGVRDLILPIQRKGFGIPITYDEQSDLHDVEAFYRQGDGDFWVALAGGEVVGSIALLDIGGGRAALRKMFVKAAYRGREHGIAAKLLARLIVHAEAAGMADIYLGTTARFLAAHRFYEKAGFCQIGEHELPDRFPRMSVDTRFYRLLLNTGALLPSETLSSPEKTLGPCHRTAICLVLRVDLLFKEEIIMKSRIDPYTAGPEAIKAMLALETYVQNAGLEYALVELVKTRASQINGCAYCIHMHTRDARAAGETEERLYLLDAWRESSLYNERERAALAWTEALTLVSQTRAPDADYDLATHHFSDKELVDLTLLICAINSWNRIAIGFSSQHPVSSEDPSTAAVSA